MGAVEEISLYDHEVKMGSRQKRPMPEEWYDPFTHHELYSTPAFDAFEEETYKENNNNNKNKNKKQRCLTSSYESFTEEDIIIGRQVMDVLGVSPDDLLKDDACIAEIVFPDMSSMSEDECLDLLSEVHPMNSAADIMPAQSDFKPTIYETPSSPLAYEMSSPSSVLPRIIQGGYEVLLQDTSLFVGPITTGPWRNEEEKLLLHIMYSFIDAELRTMAVVAWKSGIHRPKRAIDKKIKRILRFNKWRERDVPSAQQEILRLLKEKNFGPITQEQYVELNRVRDELHLLGLPSFPLLTPDAF